MKRLLVILLMFLEVDVVIALKEGVLALSGASTLSSLDDVGKKIKGFFSPRGGIALEKVMISVEEDMNDHGAVKAHLVIVYDPELITEFRKMTAREYFRDIKQLVKDHPDKLKIFEWELVAKKRVIPWVDIKYPADHMVPLAGYVFAEYSGSGEHRAKIHSDGKKIKIIFEKDTFKVEVVEKDE